MLPTKTCIYLLTAGVALVNAILPPTHLPPVARGASANPVIAQMFQWNWNSVAKECVASLGPAGYSYVQVSPATEHITGTQWYTDYQKVSNKLTSKRGTEDEFIIMVKTCASAGVGVLLDTIFNHMSAQSNGTGFAGTPFKQYEYPGLWTPDDFHYCPTEGHNILDYSDKSQVQNCQLEGLADLKTESEHVQSVHVAHANKMLSYGIAGFRVDAAKHIPMSDLTAIVSQLSRKPYITSEVISNQPPILEDEYAPLGTVSVSDYPAALRDAFNSTGLGLGSLQTIGSDYGVPSSSASTYVANQDTERGDDGGSLVASDGDVYKLANVFTLTHPYGTPTVLSSYSFENKDDGGPVGGAGSCGGGNGWLCQHRTFAGLVKFRTAVGDADLTNWKNGSAQQIAYERDGKGFVIINNSYSPWAVSLTTGLPAGKYCDVVDGGVVGTGKCSGATITVSNGRIDGTVPPKKAYAIYTGSKLAGATTLSTATSSAGTSSAGTSSAATSSAATSSATTSSAATSSTATTA